MIAKLNGDRYNREFVLSFTFYEALRGKYMKFFNAEYNRGFVWFGLV